MEKKFTKFWRENIKIIKHIKTLNSKVKNRIF